MSALEDRLAGALRELIGWIPNAAAMERIGFHSGKPVDAHKRAQEALAAYEASKSAPAVREVTAADTQSALDAYCEATPSEDSQISFEGIAAALNAFRDRLNGESQ